MQAWQAIRACLSRDEVPGLSRSDEDALSLLARVGGLSGYIFLRAGSQLSKELKAELKADFLIQAAQNIASDKMLGHILQEHEENRICCVPIKGACFRHLLYSDPAARVSVDIDLMVDDYDRSWNLLEQMGYVRVDGVDERPATRHEVYERVYRHPEYAHGILVEPHRSFSKEEKFSVDYAQVWKRSLDLSGFLNRIDLKDCSEFPYRSSTRFLCPEDAMAHQFLHNANHNFDIPVHSLLDAKLMVENWKLNWEQVVETSRRWGVSTAGYFTLEMIRVALGTDVPAWVIDSIRPSNLRLGWLSLFIVRNGLVEIQQGRPMVRFLRALRDQRLQQTLVGLPLIDGTIPAIRFSGSYLKLRLRDLWASWIN
jgi:hypothetical protein